MSESETTGSPARSRGRTGRLGRLLAVTAVAAAAGALWLFSGFSSGQPVRTALTVEGRVEPIVEGPAVVRPLEDYPINYPVGGRVARVAVAEGAMVRPETVVVELDSGDLPLRREEAAARLDAARALAVVGLSGSRDPEVERIERSLRLAEAEIGLRRIDWELDRRRIRAGAAAVVGTVYAREGQLVSPGEPAFRLVSPRVVLRMEVGSGGAALVAPGQPVSVRIEGYGETRFKARVAAIAGEVDPGDGTRAVFLRFGDDTPTLPPGTRGSARIRVPAEEGSRVLVPRRALRDRHWVWVVEKGRLVRRNVATGRMDADRAEVILGVSPGEEVVLESRSRLREGARVDPRRVPFE